MKRKVIAFILSVLLIASLIAPVSAPADTSVSFISIDDTLPPELINVVYYQGGREYLPYWVFTNYGFGIYYNYLSSCSTAYLYNDDLQVFFDLRDGSTFDSDEFKYAFPAILVGGTVYLPLSFMSAFFGCFSVSRFETDNGKVLRLKTSACVLDDSEFASAASSLMKSYAASWKASHEEKPGDSPSATPEPREEKTYEEIVVKTGFVGLPGDELLGMLEGYENRVTVFLSSEDVKNNPDRVRMLVSKGFAIGFSPDSADEIASFPRLLFEAALTETCLSLVKAPEASEEEEIAKNKSEDIEKALSSSGFALCSPLIYVGENASSPYAVTSYLTVYERALGFVCSSSDVSSAKIILDSLIAGKFNISPFRETALS
ncbi:MAG: hypothetical protein MJ067_01750 [Oscillospiraceae bacterium]|nr:hypothetical protein [Oscillospiraceae bacterium]